MDNKHTPGPWTFRQARGNNIYEHRVEAAGSGIADLIVPYSVRSPRNTKAAAEIVANARLIAAAPDLLAALKSLVQTIEYQAEANFLNEDADEGEENDLTIARAAIAKATQP